MREPSSQIEHSEAEAHFGYKKSIGLQRIEQREEDRQRGRALLERLRYKRYVRTYGEQIPTIMQPICDWRKANEKDLAWIGIAMVLSPILHLLLRIVLSGF